MTLRPTTIVALAAVALAAMVAFALQLALLGALGLTSGNSDSELALAPAANTRAASMGPTQGLRFDPTRAPAVAQAGNLSLTASNALALILHTEDVSANLRLTLGWLTTLDLRRPASATVTLNATADPKQSVVLLAGHPRWRETVTRIAFGLERADPAAAAQEISAFVGRAEWLPANPIGGARLVATAWFKSDGNIVTPKESPNRLLPLALWLALISAVSLLAVALFFRKNPEQRAEALRTCASVLALAAGLLTLLTHLWPGWTVPLGGGVAAALALLLVDRTFALPLSNPQRMAMAALMAGIATLLTPLVAAVALVPAILLWLGRTLPQAQANRWSRVGGLLALIPALLLAAVAQGMVTPPSLLNPLIDPTRTLATIATTAGGLPGLALGVLAMHRLWPAPALAPRWSQSAVAATVWALLGAIALLAIPRIAALAAGSSTYIAVFFPALACVALAVLPKFQAVARSVDETLLVAAKSEIDLSAQALTLLESHAERVQATLSRRELGAAHAALAQMKQIASAARATALAELRVALADANFASAESAAARLTQHNDLSIAEHDALLELAHRTHRQSRVIELASSASASEGNTRALAMALLQTDSATAALRPLAAWPDEHTFAREIAELHLLDDNVAAVQSALVNTGIALTEPIGQAYVARLGMRVQGPEPHVKGINSLATWHPQVGAVHAAQGELMLRQGNAAGARARFLLAMKLDAALWPLQVRLDQIDAPAQAAPS